MTSVVFACLDADTLGGIQRVTHTVAQGLAGRGYDVHVVGLHRAETPVRYVDRPGYRHHVIHATPMGAGRVSRTAARRERRWLREVFRRAGPGFAVLTSPGVVPRVIGALPDRLLPIGQYHGSYEHALGSWHLRAIRDRYGALEAAVFLSEDDAWRFAEQAPLPNAWAIPNPLPGRAHRASGLDGRRVLGVGRLEGVKRFDRLISAFAEAVRTVDGGRPGGPPYGEAAAHDAETDGGTAHGAETDGGTAAHDPAGDAPGGRWELHLVGDGAERERLREHAAACGVADRVVLRGAVPASGMEREYLAASLLALSSEHEGLPLVVGEAAACGVPAVAFDVSGGVRSLVVHGRTGLLVPPADVPALAAALARLMASRDERRRLGAAARAHVEAFRPERVLDRWEDLFTQVTR
ncbi:glycosyltransferase [Streptosporangium sp. NPDC004379]|uniref:glycosyltransferase n=1 Tax=Streptosporangium sp. NPDC004379 TaxID=3366189 RepID=UPI00368D236D